MLELASLRFWDAWLAVLCDWAHLAEALSSVVMHGKSLSMFER